MTGFDVIVVHKSASGATEARAIEDSRGRLLMSAREPIRSGDAIALRGVSRLVLNVEQVSDRITVTLGDRVE